MIGALAPRVALPREKHDDHATDALRYIVHMWMPELPKLPEQIPEDVHPGMIPGTTERRSRVRTLEIEMQEQQKSLESDGGLKKEAQNPRRVRRMRTAFINRF